MPILIGKSDKKAAFLWEKQVKEERFLTIKITISPLLMVILMI